MKKLLSIILAILMIVTSVPFAFATESTGDTIILYTNDIHGQADNLPVFAAYRTELIEQGNKVITVDAGDMFPSSKIKPLEKYNAIAEVADAAGYDYAVPGEQEFKMGAVDFSEFGKNVNGYKYISSNFIRLSRAKPVFEPYSIEEISEDMQIAFIGITTPETVGSVGEEKFKDEYGNFIYGFPTFAMQDGVLIENVQESIDSAIADGADYVVAVGHLGRNDVTEGWKSTDIIADTTGIDLFIDAHSHEVTEKAEYTDKNGNPVSLTSGGNNLEYFGQVTIKSDGTVDIELINPADINVEAFGDKAKNEYDKVYSLVQQYNALIERDAACENGQHIWIDKACDVCGIVCSHEKYTDSKCDGCGAACLHEKYTDSKCDVCGADCPHENIIDGKCDVCGADCPHENITDGKCDVCGAEGNIVTIIMTDSFGDGWNGNAVVIEQLIDGTYTEVATTTIKNGKTGEFTDILPVDDVYALKWKEGLYPGECSFTVVVNGDVVLDVMFGSDFSDNEYLYILCEHNYVDSKCDKCGSDCPHENVTDDICDCGKYMYKITHQPSEAEPYVELNDDADATYQWYKIEFENIEITDENASGDWQSLGATFENTVYEDGKWIADVWDNCQYFFMVGLEKGDIINIEFASEIEIIGLGLDGEFDELIEVYDTKYSITVEESGTYWLASVGTPVDYISATVIRPKYVPIEGATSAELNPAELGSYACEITFADNTTEMSDEFAVSTLHICDFSGEWKHDSEKHWKECSCGDTAEEAGHIYTDGVCDCGYKSEKPAEPDTPDTPDEPEDETCADCGKVHTNFFSEIICFFVRIINFIKNIFA